MFNRFLLLLILIISGITKLYSLSIPEILDIGIYAGNNIRKVSFTPLMGRYLICNSDHEKILEVTTLNSITIEKTREGFTIFKADTIVYSGKDVMLQGGSFQNSFLVFPHNNQADARIYDGDLRVRAEGNRLMLVNAVPLESYVAGTVQSESGFNKHDEFYKVQAIIIRTYALKNIHRHAREGFHLCDQVHCQAYYGKTAHNAIVDAVEKTRGKVLVDNASRLLNTVYHANCGGQTVNAEDLWPDYSSYLRSRTDTFCLRMPGARWETTISIRDMRRFLSQRYNYSPDEQQWSHIAQLRQARRIHHLDTDKRIHLRQVRENFNLRSTYFNISQQGDQLHLSGRGYGHGVGLCQEGAMRRAQFGHTKEQILEFYYQNARILTLEPVVVFR